MLPSCGYIAFWFAALFMWIIPWIQLAWFTLANIGMWHIVAILLFFTVGIWLLVNAFALVMIAFIEDEKKPIENCKDTKYRCT